MTTETESNEIDIDPRDYLQQLEDQINIRCYRSCDIVNSPCFAMNQTWQSLLRSIRLRTSETLCLEKKRVTHRQSSSLTSVTNELMLSNYKVEDIDQDISRFFFLFDTQRRMHVYLLNEEATKELALDIADGVTTKNAETIIFIAYRLTPPRRQLQQLLPLQQEQIQATPCHSKVITNPAHCRTKFGVTSPFILTLRRRCRSFACHVACMDCRKDGTARCYLRIY